MNKKPIKIYKMINNMNKKKNFRLLCRKNINNPIRRIKKFIFILIMMSNYKMQKMIRCKNGKRVYNLIFLLRNVQKLNMLITIKVFKAIQVKKTNILIILLNQIK